MWWSQMSISLETWYWCTTPPNFAGSIVATIIDLRDKRQEGPRPLLLLLLLLVVAAVAKTMLFDLASVISYLCLLVIHHFGHGFWSWGAKPVFNRNKFHLLHGSCCCCCLLLLLFPRQCYLTWNRSSVTSVYLWFITFDMAFGAEVPNLSLIEINSIHS